MKRSRLIRRSPIRRTSPARRGDRKSRYAKRQRDTDRMAWVKSQRCLLASGLAPFTELWRGGEIDRCARPIEAHHAGRHGLGQKAPDDTVIPLCDHHHDALTDRRLCFSGWPPGTLKLWELAAIAWCQELYQSRAEAPDTLF